MEIKKEPILYFKKYFNVRSTETWHLETSLNQNSEHDLVMCSEYVTMVIQPGKNRDTSPL